ncbi:Tau-tubulin kinase 1 [Trichinella pseudospiralis]|uniref:non-specific serine/threonine protein kinase n=1 Tax=Trichinella pseudospiralis TaxID=6337 RepID=A0A0V1ELG7_TRIPS|nr:Tau-tubulin kinase 1 [Trichinella pseudospiralis]
MDGVDVNNLAKSQMLFDRFRILRKLGSGGFGAVYEAYDCRFAIRVAIKVELKRRNSSTVNKEAEILMNLQGNRHVLQCLESGEQDNYNYLLMEVAAISVSNLLHSLGGRKFPLTLAAQLGCNFVKALQEVHNAGYLHRDVKPSNFVLKKVENTRRVYIIDFGLAKEIENNNVAAKKKNIEFVGTLKYASVNVHKRKPYGRNDDLMSMFYSFLEISSGLPWGDDDEEEVVALKKIEIKPRTLIGNKPEAVYQIYMKLLSLTYKDSIDYAWFINKFKSLITSNRGPADRTRTGTSQCRQQNEIPRDNVISDMSVD